VTTPAALKLIIGGVAYLTIRRGDQEESAVATAVPAEELG
jgi:hypothetical protein